jgi:peptide/nickel transport system substrate-binding protein
MTRCKLLFPVVASLVVAAAAAAPEARPRYGGTLRIEVQGALRSLDPAAAAGDTAVRELALPLVFETLVTKDAAGRLRAGLAASWEQAGAGGAWRLTLRPGVVLHDGTVMDGARVAAALRARHQNWQVSADGPIVLIDAGAPRDGLLWELADSAAAIAVRSADGQLVGTGPFRLDHLDGRELLLRAHEAHWGGRPFLDAVRITFNRALGAQLTALEAGAADVVTVRPGDARRLTQRALRVEGSQPAELFALIVEPHRTAAGELQLRRTLSAAIDRTTIARVLLQGHADAAETLLPAWLSGYPPFFVHAPGVPLPAARVLALPRERRSWTLRVAAGDAVAQAIADRIAVDARTSGFTVAVQAPTGLAPRADVRLVRIQVPVSSPERALAAVVAALSPRVRAAATPEGAPQGGAPLEETARIERAMLEPHVVVPIVHAAALFGLGERVRSFSGPVVLPTGALNLGDVWLDTDAAGPS